MQKLRLALEMDVAVNMSGGKRFDFDSSVTL